MVEGLAGLKALAPDSHRTHRGHPAAYGSRAQFPSVGGKISVYYSGRGALEANLLTVGFYSRRPPPIPGAYKTHVPCRRGGVDLLDRALQPVCNGDMVSRIGQAGRDGVPRFSRSNVGE
ncbi:hypothetical protein R1flu_005111 [Riccia fluitans]|uniref:Uncharacterized protein n=1 Tax=Riccia fluitans TaxID=41844 RepID=A0ABD1YS82_9MARC